MAAPTMTPRGIGPYLEAYSRALALRQAEPGWLQAARRVAMTAFEERGFPTTRDEDWRFTNVAPIAERAFVPAEPRPAAGMAVSADDGIIAGLAGPALVFVDGRWSPELSRTASLPGGVAVGSLAGAIRQAVDGLKNELGGYASVQERPFGALNTGLFEDGAYVRVSPGTVVEDAIQIVFVASGARPARSVHPRVLVVAGSNSQLRVVETFLGAAGTEYFTNAVTEIAAADGAVVEHYRLQRESERAYHVGQTQLHVGRSANVASHAISLGGAIARHDAVAVLAGEGAECTLNGLYLGRGQQLIDNHTEIDHAMPHGTSHEIYKGILDGRARGVFNGRIKVRPDAQKTDAKQTNKTLLLSDAAQINTKPQLEIFANDVKCTHGATVGQLNADALFYLRARGIGVEDARALLIRAFAMDVISHVRLQPVRLELDRLLAGRLPGTLAEKAFA